MIPNLRDVTSENPVRQVWKFLRYFQDDQSVSETIRRIHNVPQGEHVGNVEKQAREVGYCIRQAEEYFQASLEVGLPTRPLLLYYGAASLSSALILLKKDGTYSFGARRQEKYEDRKHNHHGLDVSGAPD